MRKNSINAGITAIAKQLGISYFKSYTNKTIFWQRLKLYDAQFTTAQFLQLKKQVQKQMGINTRVNTVTANAYNKSIVIYYPRCK